MIKLLISGNEVPFTKTIFPDGTSQIWKIDDTNVEYDMYSGDPEILWLFEGEAELMHVLQLSSLVQKHFNCETVTLNAPYLPYGRQDKNIDNKLSFALNVFKEILYQNNICRIETFDAHSESDMVYSTKPTRFHASLPQHDVICYPDLGASERYKYSFNIDNHSHISFEKVRNQLTGEITGLKLLGTSELEGRSILIVDDICDGGMTFIKVAEALRPYKPKQVNLAVSHGLFSRGKECLYEAGIKEIFTTNSLLRNPDGFKVW